MRPLDVNTSAILSYLDREIQDVETKLSDLRRQRASILELAEKVAGTPQAQKIDKGEEEQKPQRLILRRKESRQQGTAGERIRAALMRMGGDFTSKVLLEEANNDGGPEIPRNTFAPEFSKLLKEKIIIAVRQQIGNTPGIYRLNDSEPGSQSSRGESGF